MKHHDFSVGESGMDREHRLLRFAGETPGDRSESKESEVTDADIAETCTNVLGRVGDWWQSLSAEDRGEISDKVQDVVSAFKEVIAAYGQYAFTQHVLGPEAEEAETEAVPKERAEEVVEQTRTSLEELRRATPRSEPLPENDAAREAFRRTRDEVVDSASGISAEQYAESFGTIDRQLIGNCYMMCVLNGLSASARETLIRTSVEMTSDAYLVYLPMGRGRSGTPVRVSRELAEGSRISRSSPGINAVLYALGTRYVDRVRSSVQFSGNRFSTLRNPLIVNAMNEAGLIARIGRENPPSPELVVAVMGVGGDDVHTMEDLLGVTQERVQRFGGSNGVGVDQSRNYAALDRYITAFASNRNRSVLTLSAHRADGESITLQNHVPPPTTYDVLVGVGHVIAVVGATERTLTLVDSNRPGVQMIVSRTEALAEFDTATAYTLDNLSALPA